MKILSIFCKWLKAGSWFQVKSILVIWEIILLICFIIGANILVSALIRSLSLDLSLSYVLISMVTRVRSALSSHLRGVDTKLISPLNPKKFMDYFGNLVWRLVALSLETRGNKINGRIQMLTRYARYLLVLTKRHGASYVVKYLKASQLAVQKSIAGQPLRSLRELEPDLPLPRLTRAGLPAFIGLNDRRSLRSGSLRVIRLYLTFFSLYRVISDTPKLKLNTITDPFKGDLYSLEQVSLYVKNFDVMTEHIRRWVIFTSENGLLYISKASSTSSVSWLSAIVDIHTLMTTKATGYKSLIAPLYKYIGLTNTVLTEQFGQAIKMYKELSVACPRSDFIQAETSKLGKLSIKLEPAGKVRVFAMVDVWTQSALKGLHDYLFKILSRIPNDGTFDQDASFVRACEKAKASGASFGYDLSAATDRLPISVQEVILSSLIGSELSSLWRLLLVDRDYRLTQEPDATTGGIRKLKDPKDLRYSVGQPMGALSSWAMLAITHHAIVQYAAHLAGRKPYLAKWYSNYEVLGDDIVIFDKDVALKYLMIMASLGVDINLSKSVVCEELGNVVEYAKRTSYKSHDVSALSWKMLSQLSVTLSGKASIAYHLAAKKTISLSQAVWIMSSPGRRSLRHNLNVQPMYQKLMNKLQNAKLLSLREVLSLMIPTNFVDAWRWYYEKQSLLVDIDQANKLLVSQINGKWSKPVLDRVKMTMIEQECPYIKRALIKKVKVLLVYLDEDWLRKFSVEAAMLLPESLPMFVKTLDWFKENYEKFFYNSYLTPILTDLKLVFDMYGLPLSSSVETQDRLEELSMDQLMDLLDALISFKSSIDYIYYSFDKFLGKLKVNPVRATENLKLLRDILRLSKRQSEVVSVKRTNRGTKVWDLKLKRG